MTTYTQGVAWDGPAILKDGEPMMPEQIVDELNALTAQVEVLQATVRQYVTEQPAANEPRTPSARWRETGEPDPHSDYINRERANLMMGNLTDDELANSVFMFNHRTGLESIMYLQAAKERIRWLSRQLAAANSDHKKAHTAGSSDT